MARRRSSFRVQCSPPVRHATTASGAGGLFDLAEHLTGFPTDLLHRALVLEVEIPAELPNPLLEFAFDLVKFAFGLILCAGLHVDCTSLGRASMVCCTVTTACPKVRRST